MELGGTPLTAEDILANAAPRAQPLPVMAQVSGLLTAVITGINMLVTALTGFNVFGGNAAGVVVNVLVIEPSA